MVKQQRRYLTAYKPYFLLNISLRGHTGSRLPSKHDESTRAGLLLFSTVLWTPVLDVELCCEDKQCSPFKFIPSA